MQIVCLECNSSMTLANPYPIAGSMASILIKLKDYGLIRICSFCLPRFPDEPRFLAVGRIDERFFTAIFTERDDKIRLISIRRAREEESKLYEQNQQN